jgi:hypothetical protein
MAARVTAPRVMTAIVVRPQRRSSSSSGGPNARIAEVINGTSAISTKIPTLDPMADAIAAQPMAVRARPCSAIGCPSINVAALGPVPGTLNRMAVIDPMKVAPPTIPPKVSITGSGSHVSVKGTASAINVTPLMPGRNATAIARSVPAIG